MAGIRAEFVGQDKLARTCATSAVPKPTKKRTNAASKKPRNTRKAERFAIAAELGPWKRIKIRSPLTGRDLAERGNRRFDQTRQCRRSTNF